MSSFTQQLLKRTRQAETTGQQNQRTATPQGRLVLVTCMDTRINPYRLLGLAEGEIHILRNAGGIVTDDVIRSLTISQRKLQTEEIVVMQHTDCGMAKFDGHEFKRDIEIECNAEFPCELGTFVDPFDCVRKEVEKLQSSPFLRSTRITGCVYDVDTDRVLEVTTSQID